MLQKMQLTAEQEVLLGSVRSDRGQDTRIRELIKSGIHWAVLRDMAISQGVLPLLYHRLQEFGQKLVPGQEMARVRDFYKANSRRNLVMTSELVKVLSLLRAHDCMAIPFKGPVLAVHAYGDVCLRQFSDLDLLVRREDIKKAEGLLTAHNYRLWYHFTPAQEKSHLRRTCEFTFLPERGVASLDVHWRFAAEYLAASSRALSDDFTGYGTMLLEGHEVPMLPDDIMLLYLCMHGTFHLWHKLSMICDIARLINASTNLDWRKLLNRATAAGLRRTLLLGLALAKDLMGTNVPERIETAIAADPDIETLQEHATKCLFAPDRGEPGFAEKARFQLLVKDSLLDRGRYCFIRAFVPTIEDWKIFKLPDGLYFIYFFIRVLRLAGLITSRH